MRRGSLRMIFDCLKLPDGTVQPAGFELFSTESNSTKTANKGTVHPTVSKKRLALHLGGTALAAKLSDDLSEEALATSAGRPRWYGLAASTTFHLLQRGGEVKLKPGEIIEVDLVRDGTSLIDAAGEQVSAEVALQFGARPAPGLDFRWRYAARSKLRVPASLVRRHECSLEPKYSRRNPCPFHCA